MISRRLHTLAIGGNINAISKGLFPGSSASEIPLKSPMPIPHPLRGRGQAGAEHTGDGVCGTLLWAYPYARRTLLPAAQQHPLETGCPHSVGCAATQLKSVILHLQCCSVSLCPDPVPGILRGVSRLNVIHPPAGKCVLVVCHGPPKCPHVLII